MRLLLAFIAIIAATGCSTYDVSSYLGEGVLKRNLEDPHGGFRLSFPAFNPGAVQEVTYSTGKFPRAANPRASATLFLRLSHPLAIEDFVKTIIGSTRQATWSQNISITIRSGQQTVFESTETIANHSIGFGRDPKIVTSKTIAEISVTFGMGFRFRANESYTIELRVDPNVSSRFDGAQLAIDFTDNMIRTGEI